MKTNRFRIQINLSAVLLLTVSAHAQFNYTTNDSTITITGYIGTNTAITIPSTINGLPVTSIGEDAFFGDAGLTNVFIPNGITNIGAGSFDNCAGLATVTIPSSVISIGDWAFSYAGLATIIIPTSVASIGDSAFYGCPLTNVVLGGGVSQLGEFAFANCPHLTEITASTNNPVFTSSGGALFNHDLTTIVEYPGGLAGSYTIPASVRSIGNGAFAWCLDSLKSVTIPDSVSNIGDSAFTWCVGLTNISIPDSVANIGASAFEGCYNITSVRIPASVTNIGDTAFTGAVRSGITVDIDNEAYTSTSGVLFNKERTRLIQYPMSNPQRSYTIPFGVTSIADYAFSGAGLDSLTIPDTLANIEADAFISFYAPTIVIPNSVTNIGVDAFADSSLTNATIGNGLVNLGEQAFYNCSGLKHVYFQGNAPPVIGSGFFGRDAELTSIYYDQGTTGWTATFDGVPTVELGSDSADFTFITNNGAITITGYNGPGGALDIPETISGLPVVSIGNDAFDGYTAPYSLTSVLIPNSVTNIGDGAFENCAGLTSVTIGNGAANIGQYAFYDCTSLTAVYFLGSAPAADSTVFEYDENVAIHFLPGTTGWGPLFAGISALEVSYQTIDDPLASQNYSFAGTWAQGVSGQKIVGYYIGNSGGAHGFVYNNGCYESLNDPAATNAAYNGQTYAQGISGTNIVGYFDAGNETHGFLYNGSSYKTFDDPNGVGTTYAKAISGNNIVGLYYIGNDTYGFLYNGTNYITLNDGYVANGVSGDNVVGSTYYFDYAGFLYNGNAYADINDPNGDTQVNGIDGPNIVGSSGNSGFVSFGNYSAMDGVPYFVGTFTPLNDPNVGAYESTTANGISSNTIVGTYVGSGGVSHGFVAKVTPEYTICLSASPAAGGTMSGYGTFASGCLQPVTAAANSGYTFRNWTENGVVVSSSTNFNFILGSNTCLVANFSGSSTSRYQTLDGPPSESDGTFALGVSGTNVVGTYIGDYSSGFLFDGSFPISNINIPSGNYPFTIVTGISRGNVVGWYTGGAEAHGFIYSNGDFTTLNDPNAAPDQNGTFYPSGGIEDLLATAQFDGWGGTFASAIDGENVVGWYVDTNGYTHGFLYNGTNYVTLDDPNGIGATYAQGISGNNIVGWYIGTNGVTHGFLYNGSSFANFDDPNGDTYPQGISGSNIVGWFANSTNGDHGFLFNGSAFTTLDVPNALGGGTTYAQGVDGNTVVGEYYDGNGTPHGFVYSIEIGMNYTITLNASPVVGGTVNGAGTFPSGGSQTVTGVANSGYEFLDWTENGVVVSSSPSYAFTLSSNVNLVANFIPEAFPKIILSAPQSTVANSNFTFQLSGPAGTNYVLQASTNLVDWNSISTSSIPISGSITLTNAINGYNRRFYRVHLQ